MDCQRAEEGLPPLPVSPLDQQFFPGVNMSVEDSAVAALPELARKLYNTKIGFVGTLVRALGFKRRKPPKETEATKIAIEKRPSRLFDSKDPD